MKPDFCEKHGMQMFPSSSPALARLASEDIETDSSNIKKIKMGGLSYWVDTPFFNEIFPKREKEEVVILKNRSHIDKKLYDRVLIVKIVSKLVSVCPVCLENFLKKYNKFDGESLEN